jgi:hypothetical protein
VWSHGLCSQAVLQPCSASDVWQAHLVFSASPCIAFGALLAVGGGLVQVTRQHACMRRLFVAMDMLYALLCLLPHVPKA